MINALLVKNTVSDVKPFYTGFGKIIFIDIKPEKIICRQFPLKKETFDTVILDCFDVYRLLLNCIQASFAYMPITCMQ